MPSSTTPKKADGAAAPEGPTTKMTTMAAPGGNDTHGSGDMESSTKKGGDAAAIKPMMAFLFRQASQRKGPAKRNSHCTIQSANSQKERIRNYLRSDQCIPTYLWKISHPLTLRKLPNVHRSGGVDLRGPKPDCLFALLQTPHMMHPLRLTPGGWFPGRRSSGAAYPHFWLCPLFCLAGRTTRTVQDLEGNCEASDESSAYRRGPKLSSMRTLKEISGTRWKQIQHQQQRNQGSKIKTIS
ncbi:unnamed protein product [Nesidiocoris tenuis]|uniref:Uncharacterized protein n=1 Tax=Nesidiocoris tenuis TaxID=355587 RepID=A0A6H5H7S1_9HEMI|nr:unnamed protein product [Nesidiocoris tenuis]